MTRLAPWDFSRHRLLIGKPGSEFQQLGFDDGDNDGDFNDVVLNICHFSPKEEAQSLA